MGIEDRPPGEGPAGAQAHEALLPALLAEERLSGRGSVALRRIGEAFAVLGLLLGLADRRLVQVGAANWIGDTSITLLQVGSLLAALGLLVLAVSLALPKRRLLVAPLVEPHQRFATMLRRERVRAVVGWLLLGAAAVWAAYGVVVAAPAEAILHVAGALLLSAIGVPLLLASAVRTPVVRRLLAQEVLWQATPTGPDPRVAVVLRHLDSLLGALPDQEVRAFMAAPEAKLYLELLEEALAAPEDTPEPGSDEDLFPGLPTVAVPSRAFPAPEAAPAVHAHLPPTAAQDDEPDADGGLARDEGVEEADEYADVDADEHADEDRDPPDSDAGGRDRHDRAGEAPASHWDQTPWHVPAAGGDPTGAADAADAAEPTDTARHFGSSDSTDEAAEVASRALPGRRPREGAEETDA